MSQGEYDSREWCGCGSCLACFARTAGKAHEGPPEEDEGESINLKPLRAAAHAHRLGELTDRELVGILYDFFDFI